MGIDVRWESAPPPPNEARRLQVLQSYCVLDTPREKVFDDLAALAAELFEVPIVLISLVDENRQFFKSAIGFSSSELPRKSAFCGYTILDDAPLILLDTHMDLRFRDNPLVTGNPFIRFYAGVPLIGREGMALGSFCIIDPSPRAEFTTRQINALLRFASLATNALEQRLYLIRIASGEKAVAEANERYHLATLATTEGIWDWDCTTDVIYHSARLRTMIGEAPVDTYIPLHEWLQRVHPSDCDIVRSNVARLRNTDLPRFETEYRIQHRDGSWKWVHSRGIAVRNDVGDLLKVVGALADITSQKFIDPVTGLHTRASLMNILEQRSNYSLGLSKKCALILIDLNSFKRVNSSLGRSAGDLLLVECARRIKETVQNGISNVVAHVAGDEFAILLENVEGEEQVIAYADILREALQVPFEIRGQRISMTAGIGVALVEKSGDRPDHLIQWAEVARHESKIQGDTRTVIFSGRMQERVLRRISLASDLREALNQGSLSLHYQPQLELATGQLVGFEALARWEHVALGPIAPSEFISIAEESALILELGRWTLREAIRQLAAWRQSGVVPTNATIAVNLSARQFADPDLLPNIQRKLLMHGLPAQCLSLEVTEGILIEDQEKALRILQHLKEIGVGLDLDDFGTGYSSMAYLQLFPFDVLKIDRSFVMNMHQDAGSVTLVRSIVALGQALGLRVVAEGIECTEHLRLLKEMGCNIGQGYLFSKPVSADQIPPIVKKEFQPFAGVYK